MKKLLVLASVLGVATTVAHAASYSVSNTNGPILTNAIVDSQGVFVSGGSVALGGYLGGAPSFDSVASMDDVLTGFTALGTSTVGVSGPVSGSFTVTASPSGPLADLTSPAAAPWVGQSLYIIVGNAAVLSESTEVMVILLNGTIPGSEPTTVSTILHTAGTVNGQILLGDFGAFSIDPSVSVGGAVPQSAFNLVAIPEPSAALLGMLGALGLLRRRR